jgi:DHA1 family bicyclomycin/chloramphenicol resistance-like MFS transporter
VSPRDTPPEAARIALRPPIWVLVAIISIGPFTMQIVVPSLPAMSRDLGAAVSTIQLVITLYLAAVGLGQLFYGPLSDRFGRRPLLLGGLAVYAVASMAAAAAPDAGWLIAARVVQAFGACAGVVIARAVIRDVWPRDEAASVLGYVTMGMTIAPMVAPVAGSLLDAWLGWRAAMAACLALGLPLAALVFFRLKETLPAPVPMPGLGAVVGAYRSLLAIPAFRLNATLTFCATGVFFAFLGGAPYAVVQGMGHSPVTFAVAFATVSIAYALGNWISGRYAVQLGAIRLLRIGVAACTLGALLTAVLLVLLGPSLAGFFVPMFLVAVGNGMTQPASVSGALSARPQLAGTAAALIGALQMGFGAAVSFFVSLVEFGAGIGTSLTMAGCGIGAWLVLRALVRTEQA